jgi:hypothetical protein
MALEFVPVYVTDSTGQVWQIGANPGGMLTMTAVTPSGPSLTGGYPTLETVMNLVRLFLNDWQPGATNTPGEGRITTDNPAISPQTLPALNSAIRELYRELRNVGDPTLIWDNVQANLPANSVTGPTVQTYLGYNGYWDGGVLNPSPVLPANLIYPIELWEQQTGNQLPFVRMHQPQFGLPSRNQTFALGEWEWRQDQINFVGTLAPVTIRMRFLAALTQFVSPLNFSAVQIPIMDCEEAVAYKVAAKTGKGLSGVNPSTSDLAESAKEAMFQLKNAIARKMQTIEFNRKPFSGEEDHDQGGVYL